MQVIAVIALAVLSVFVIVELVWARVNARRVHDMRDSLGNLVHLIGGQLVKPLSIAWSFAVYGWVAPLQVFQLPHTAWAFALTFIVVDCAYYWYHRLSHQTPFLWALHHTHHSSPWLNLTTAVRLNWLARFVTPLFFTPLVLLGFSPAMVAGSLALGLAFQFFLHTQAIGRLGRFEGLLLNTPSAHRVHHGSNSEYIDKNFGGVFILWDRLFGTYQREEAIVRYGVTTGFIGYNPVVVQLKPMWQFLRGEWKPERQIAAERLGSQAAKLQASS